jgi:hypothetical protein
VDYRKDRILRNLLWEQEIAGSTPAAPTSIYSHLPLFLPDLARSLTPGCHQFAAHSETIA